MKKHWYIRGAALASISWMVVSCVSVAPQFGDTPPGFSEAPIAGIRPRFQEGATADVVLRFFKWDAINMIRPDTRADGYLPLYARDDIGREVKSRNIKRDTAVVVVSLFYRDPALLAELSRDWTAYLNEQGFRRVVLLHAGPGNDIDGLPVVNDSTIAAVHEEQPKVVAANAAVPATAGANVANPSSPSIR